MFFYVKFNNYETLDRKYDFVKKNYWIRFTSIFYGFIDGVVPYPRFNKRLYLK